MQVDSARIEEIFGVALEKADAGARAAYLDEACSGDAALRKRVVALLAAHDATGNRLALPEANGATVAYVPLSEGPGTKIGRYKLLEQIGEGGFGVVFMAEQEEPVRRRVALKIIKLGMDTKQVVARFEAERQALAMMDHPNIAKVLDGGATETGRPYFVMELVRGIPITSYCDQNKLATVDRLKLFIAVCSAVQHAHQKGIIHRDLKPTNVLVTMHDDRPVPKIIDFGIAKATQARLTERTLFTEFRQMIGTPAYMSPEQAQMSGIDVDTRSDIYSLGVLLYELLTGTTPFASKELMSAGYAEMQRMIREVEPPPPSTRLVDSQDSLPSIAAQRQTEPAKLTKLMRGDLDWIVMRCLEKDRTRRYETATSLSQDIERYLTDEPVEARRPTRLYRLKKFIRRNQIGVLAGTAIVAALAVGLAAASYFAASASREAKNATAALAQAEVSRKTAEGVNKFFTEEVFGLADPNHYDRAGITLVEALDIAASKIDQKFPDDPALRAEIRDRFGEIYFEMDRPQQAVEQLREAVKLRCELAGSRDPITMRSRSTLGYALYTAHEWNEARGTLESTLADQSEVLGGGSRDAVQTAAHLSNVLMEIRKGFWSRHRDDVDALGVAEKAYWQALAALGPDDESTLEIEKELGWNLRWEGRPKDALEYDKAAALGLRRINGIDNTAAMAAEYNYAACLHELGRLDEALAEIEPLLKTQYRVLGPLHVMTQTTAWRLALVLTAKGQKTEAAAVLDEVLTHLDEIASAKNLSTARNLFDIANVYIVLERMDRAAAALSVTARIYGNANDKVMREHLYYLKDLAQVFATSRHVELRDGKRAVEIATRACELSGYKDPDCVDTLAAAYEEVGDKEAVAKTREALKALQAEHPAGER